MKKISRDLRTDERVTFHGRVTDDELNLAYSSADIYLIPTTRYEGLPLALLEAMAHGIPTISSEIGGNSDVITHNHDGICNALRVAYVKGDIKMGKLVPEKIELINIPQ